jgi:uncharacterized membrane protein
MRRFRGLMMLVVGCYGIYRGLTEHTLLRSLIGFGIGALAIPLGIWHLTRTQHRLDT